MKLNSDVKVIGNKVILVPYRRHHVPKYHEWMKSVELQFLTASIPLTLEKEYEMQESWTNDEDKCTFIILDKTTYNDTHDECASMIGDTNIFLTSENSKCIGEVEIMIAEKQFHGKKYGWEAVILMLLYGLKYVKVDIYEVKINITNKASIKMFRKLRFVDKAYSQVFEEMTLERHVEDSWVKWLERQVKFEINPY